MSTIVAITGGIACGKSHCLQRIADTLDGDGQFFSCDEAVSKLLTEPEIIGSLVCCIGGKIFEDGAISRPFLREKIFESAELREQVESIIHPAVLKKAEAFLEESRMSRIVLMEVPLLYEVSFPLPRDFDLVIGCSEQTQLARLTNFREIPLDQANLILEAQLSIQVKLNRSDFVAWNDGTIEVFDYQIDSILETILSNNIGDDRRN